MKKNHSVLLIVSAMAFGLHINTYAANLDDSLEMDSSALTVSKNYDDLKNDDDGRVTLVGPKFGAADGTVRWISATANLSGVCKLFGYGLAIESSLLGDGDFDRTIVINSDGMFGGFKDYSYLDTAHGRPNGRISSIMCENSTSIGPSSRAKLVKNDDGTTTLLDPSFSYADGTERKLSSVSDAGGVCHLFGFSSAVPGSVLTDGDDDRSVVIGSSSKFTGFKAYSILETLYGRPNTHITSVVCD